MAGFLPAIHALPCGEKGDGRDKSPAMTVSYREKL
jgi:hypothetical protein